MKFLYNWLKWQLGVVRISRPRLLDMYAKSRAYTKTFTQYMTGILAIWIYLFCMLAALMISGYKDFPTFWFLGCIIVPMVVISYMEYRLHLREEGRDH